MKTPHCKLSFNQADQDLLWRTLIGSSAVGGGASLLVGLAKHVNMLKQQRTRAEDVEEETLRIELPKAVKQAADVGPSTWGLAGMAPVGIAGAVGGFHLVQKLYSALQKKELEDELADAQETFRHKLRQEQLMNAKEASSDDRAAVGLTTSQTMQALGLAAITVPGVASMLVSQRLLDKWFPKVKKPMSDAAAPIRVAIPQEEEEAEKQASYDIDAAAILPVLLTMGAFKEASDVRRLVDKVASEGMESLESLVHQHGWSDQTFAACPQEDLGLNHCVKAAAVLKIAAAPSLAPGFATILAAECQEMSPRLSMGLGAVDPGDADSLVKWAADFGRAFVWESAREFSVDGKSAATLPQLMAAIERAKAGTGGAAAGDEKDTPEQLITSDVGQGADSRGPNAAEGITLPAKDGIDTALSGASKPERKDGPVNR